MSKYDVALFGASTDPFEKNKQFAEKLELSFPLLSDSNKKVAEAYGILRRGSTASRVAILVDKQGKVIHIENKVDLGNHGRQLLRLLEKHNVPQRSEGVDAVQESP